MYTRKDSSKKTCTWNTEFLEYVVLPSWKSKWETPKTSGEVQEDCHIVFFSFERGQITDLEEPALAQDEEAL
jgi:hypothetical protein